jgi:two-component system chemotaxis response regulator CheY
MAKKVLVVDDSSTVRQQVGLVLTQAGFQVVEAVDGVDGVNKIGSTPDLSLVICDVNMPQMNGIELVEKVMSDGKNAGLPILMLTTEGQASLIERAKKAGAKGWMVKPFKPDLLLAAANKISRSA